MAQNVSSGRTSFSLSWFTVSVCGGDSWAKTKLKAQSLVMLNGWLTLPHKLSGFHKLFCALLFALLKGGSCGLIIFCRLFVNVVHSVLSTELPVIRLILLNSQSLLSKHSSNVVFEKWKHAWDYSRWPGTILKLLFLLVFTLQAWKLNCDHISLVFYSFHHLNVIDISLELLTSFPLYNNKLNTHCTPYLIAACMNLG